MPRSHRIPDVRAPFADVRLGTDHGQRQNTRCLGLRKDEGACEAESLTSLREVTQFKCSHLRVEHALLLPAPVYLSVFQCLVGGSPDSKAQTEISHVLGLSSVPSQLYKVSSSCPLQKGLLTARVQGETDILSLWLVFCGCPASARSNCGVGGRLGTAWNLGSKGPFQTQPVVTFKICSGQSQTPAKRAIQINTMLMARPNMIACCKL